MKWLTPVVLTSIIGFIISTNGEAIQDWLSARNPFEVHASARTKAPGFFDMVVADPRRLPPNAADVKDCKQLWKIGTDAGGIRADLSAYNVLLQGNAKDGVAITDMRAKITRRAPATDGALLSCPAAGTAEPIGLLFDLATADSAPAMRADPTQGIGFTVKQFADGFSINVAEKESVPLSFETSLPSDSIEWHVEADIIVGGDLQTVVIDNEGKDFYSPGRRMDNQYTVGHGAGVLLNDWGVDDRTVRTTGPNGSAVKALGPVMIPDEPGVDFYQPAELMISDRDSPYRWVRHDGRKLIDFNPPGVAAREIPVPGSSCGGTGPYGDDLNAHNGFVRTQTIVDSSVRDHAGQPFDYQTIDLQCNMSDASHNRDGQFGTAEFWTCGHRPCPEELHRLQILHMKGSSIVFIASSNEITDADRLLTDKLLAELQIRT